MACWISAWAADPANPNPSRPARHRCASNHRAKEAGVEHLPRLAALLGKDDPAGSSPDGGPVAPWHPR
eukprot:1741239-Alexandrium_andersonii.AAC.1